MADLPRNYCKASSTGTIKYKGVHWAVHKECKPLEVGAEYIPTERKMNPHVVKRGEMC